MPERFGGGKGNNRFRDGRPSRAEREQKELEQRWYTTMLSRAALSLNCLSENSYPIVTAQVAEYIKNKGPKITEFSTTKTVDDSVSDTVTRFEVPPTATGSNVISIYVYNGRYYPHYVYGQVPLEETAQKEAQRVLAEVWDVRHRPTDRTLYRYGAPLTSQEGNIIGIGVNNYNRKQSGLYLQDHTTERDVLLVGGYPQGQSIPAGKDEIVDSVRENGVTILGWEGPALLEDSIALTARELAIIEVYQRGRGLGSLHSQFQTTHARTLGTMLERNVSALLPAIQDAQQNHPEGNTYVLAPHPFFVTDATTAFLQGKSHLILGSNIHVPRIYQTDPYPKKKGKRWFSFFKF